MFIVFNYQRAVGSRIPLVEPLVFFTLYINVDPIVMFIFLYRYVYFILFYFFVDPIK